jgi:hypothetical protein
VGSSSYFNSGSQIEPDPLNGRKQWEPPSVSAARIPEVPKSAFNASSSGSSTKLVSNKYLLYSTIGIFAVAVVCVLFTFPIDGNVEQKADTQAAKKSNLPEVLSTDRDSLPRPNAVKEQPVAPSRAPIMPKDSPSPWKSPANEIGSQEEGKAITTLQMEGQRQAEQPESNPSLNESFEQEYRVWHDSRRFYSAEAYLISFGDDNKEVIIERKDGKQCVVPVYRLSKEDRDYIDAKLRPSAE